MKETGFIKKIGSVTTVFLIIVVLIIGCKTHGHKLPKKQSDKAISKVNHPILQTGWYYVVDATLGIKRQLDKDSAFYYLDPAPITTARNIRALEIFHSEQYNYVGLKMLLDSAGITAWRLATGKSISKRLGFILDNKLLMTAVVQSEQIGGVTVLNDRKYSQQELEVFKTIIEKEK